MVAEKIFKFSQLSIEHCNIEPLLILSLPSEKHRMDILDLYAADPRVLDMVEYFQDPSLPRFQLTGLEHSAQAFLFGAAYKNLAKTYLIVLEDKEEAAYFQNDLKNILGKKDVLFFPDSFKKSGQFESLNKNNILMRAESLSKLMSSITTGELLVTYPAALFEKVVNTQTLAENTLHLKINEKLDIDFIVEVLVEYGFEHHDFVYEPGQFSVRGGIVDIYSFGNELPYRVELFDDEVESIRIFDPISQLSEKKIAQVNIVPNVQSHFDNKVKTSLLKLLPDDTVIWIKNTKGMLEQIEHFTEKTQNILSKIQDVKNLPVDSPFRDMEAGLVKAADIKEELNDFTIVEWGKGFLFDGKKVAFSISPQPPFKKNFDLLIADLKKKQADKYLSFIFTENPKQIIRFEQIFEDLEANVEYKAIHSSIKQGFIDNDLKLAIYTDHQIFDRFYKYKTQRSFSKQKAVSIRLLKQLDRGDFVTHIDHGIGEFVGLQKIEINGKSQEVVRLKYKDGDTLFVGIQSLHKISKYVGKEGHKPKIYKLGSKAWENLKRKTKSKIKDIAKDLIKLYAVRKSAKGFAFAPDSYLQRELESSFIYEDTPDQVKATQDIKADMEAESPMDRLICGDVGFGKTEVAIRATAKALADSKQVAILVPTAILAMQHFKTFTERLKEFPCKVDYLNRFKTAKQKRETLAELAEGKVDVIIGTHALLGKTVKFKDLGLLVIDEEQKFGVSAKEKLRQLKVNVDTLTLTATPIPRTLQFSLMSARDLSIIRTPPPNRQPVTTELMTFNAEKIRDAIYYEIHRGGQVFFVHNRVKDLHEMAAMLNKYCPDIDIGVAHGQLDNKSLEDKMMKFEKRVYDVLLCTNIVESGLDIPNANTIIINNAHHFGLSDLHQLRGRVGRSNQKAFCYLISPPLFGLPDHSKKRLKTIEQYAELGSGFNIAMKDLDIRGAGNILGAEQSGFIADIGFETYQKILAEAIQELKETEFKEVFAEQLEKEKRYVQDCQVETDLDMLIPNDYVNSNDERLLLYRDLDNADNEEELQIFKKELTDRFGPMPLEVNELLYAVRIKWIATRLGFERIIIKGGKLRAYFISNPESPYFESPIFQQLMNLVMKDPDLQKRCQIKQSNKYFYLVFAQVKTIRQGRELLQNMESTLTGEAVVA